MQQMKAWVLHDIGDFRLEDVELPHIEKNEVLVQIKAVGICGSDIPRIYQNGAHVSPLIPGHEFAGIVEKTGENVDARWKGKRVGVFPLIPCKSCIPCQRKQYEMCRHYSYLGSRRDGGFAEYVAVPQENLMELPDGVSFEAAAMLEPMAVAVHAMRRVLGVQKSIVEGNYAEKIILDDEFSEGSFLQSAKHGKIAVCGLGTIGLLLVMFLKEAGMTDLLVIGNKEFQKQMVLKIGISEEQYCDSRTQDVSQWIKERTDGMGVDVFFECVGKNETLCQAVENTAPAGRVCLVGNPYSDMLMEKDLYWKILRNQLTVTGTWNSSFTQELTDDWHYVLERLENKKIIPEALISHEFSLVEQEMERGFHIMRDKIEDYVKIMGIRRIKYGVEAPVQQHHFSARTAILPCR